MDRWNKVRIYIMGALVAIILFSAIGLLMPAATNRAVDWLTSLKSNAKTLAANYQNEQDPLIEVTIEKIIVGTMETGPAILLKEKNGDRYLPVSVGMSEARAIAIALQGRKPPRPLTHDLLRGVIHALEAEVQSVIIEELRDGIYYSKVVLNDKGKTVEVDSRPSDAIALSLRTGTPIYTREKLLENIPSPGGIKSKADM